MSSIVYVQRYDGDEEDIAAKRYARGCDSCGSEVPTYGPYPQRKVGNFNEAEDVFLCPFCYETEMGEYIHYRTSDPQRAETAKMIAQGLNLLHRLIKEEIANASNTSNG